MQVLKWQIHLVITKVYVMVVSTSLLLSCIILPVYDMAPLETWMWLWSKSGSCIKPPVRTRPALLRGGYRVKAGFLQLDNVGAYECFLPLWLFNHHPSQGQDQGEASWVVAAKYEEAHTFRATLLIFSALVACLPHPRPRLDLSKTIILRFLLCLFFSPLRL